MTLQQELQLIRHLVSVEDWKQEDILSIFDLADQFRHSPRTARQHEDKVVGLLFYEPSTRTHLSFASAVCRLGAQHIGFTNPQSASVAKGEGLIDTIRVVQRYCDAIVMRHPAEGSARLASLVGLVPIINGGDGGHEHPTQTLCDLYTIWQRFGDIRGRTVGLIGDLRFGRAAHSLALALASFGAHLVCLAPDDLQMPDYLLQSLRAQTRVYFSHQLDDVIGDLDVLYVTRLQKERMQSPTRTHNLQGYPLTKRHLEKARHHLLLLHPLPIDREIFYEVDEDPRAWYFEQSANGVPIRMALLHQMLTEATPLTLGAFASAPEYPQVPWLQASSVDLPLCRNQRCVTHYENGIAPRYETISAGAQRCFYCDHTLT